MGLRSLEERREWIWPGFLYADDLVLYTKSEEDLKVMVDVLLKCIREEV